MMLRFLLSLVILSVVSVSANFAAETQNILLIAGAPSHGYGSHEHYAGLKILEESLNSNQKGLEITVVRGWPDNDELIEAAD